MLFAVMNPILSLESGRGGSTGATSVLSRSASRLSRASYFVIETLVHAATETARDASPLERAEHCSWVMENICALHGIQIVQHGEVLSEPAIYVANHVSYVEPIAMLARVAGTAIAKREIGTWPVIGDAVRSLGVLLVDRSRPESGAAVLREAWRSLDAGVSLVVFPEGTTTPGDTVLPFRRGVFGLARLAGVPIVPVTVRYDRRDVAWIGDDPFVPHYLRTTAHPRTRVFLTFDEPIRPERTDLDAEGLARLARRRILARLSR